MNEQLLSSVIKSEITNNLIQFVDEMTTDEFVEKILDNYYQIEKTEIDEDVVKDKIGDVVLPLYRKLSEYLIETNMVSS